MKNYFVYLPDNLMGGLWQCTTTSLGYTRIPPNTSYPPGGHPRDHDFSWAKGRILHAYQIIFISDGSGTFESLHCPRKHHIDAGTAMLLFPGEWHRYMPDATTGWVEHWLECRGPALERLRKAGILDPEKPLYETGHNPDLLEAFERGHLWAQADAMRNQSLLSVLGLQILAILDQIRHQRAGIKPRIEEYVQKAQAIIVENHARPLNMPQIAQELRVSYSYLRQGFKRVLGVSPKQYHMQVRLHRARDILANTTRTIKEISEQLGFDSPFHLSSQFKATFGTAPSEWRNQLSQPHPELKG